jgi:ribonuclease HII|tara:strand:- start:2348 stop:2947 length:600 start_codon:yes stop_codon:yes gene_type:complete
MLKAFHSKGLIEAGCDEAGRGCLAGPVVASAVILPTNFKHILLNDSKQLTHKQRELLEPIIKEKAICWAIGIVSPQEIDEINILNASFLAMHRAIEKLKEKIDLLLIDGNRFNPYKNIEHLCIVKGDSKYASIAAASVLAKNYRDELMIDLDSDFPQYDWKNNKGYPTAKHRTAIGQIGISKHHRKSYQLLPTQIKIEF